MKKSLLLKIVIGILLCEGIGVLGSFFTTPSIGNWYADLTKPALNPPNWLFAPVWTTLFLLMGIAAALVWAKFDRQKEARRALVVFGIQLVLNLFWSVLFFGLHLTGYAFVEIVLLWVTILLTVILFYRVSKPAAYLLVPYLAWVGFAGYLNLSLWLLNRDV